MTIVNTHQAEAWNDYEGRHWARNQHRYDRMLAASNVLLFEAAGIERGHRVLDIGCGTGQTTRIAARMAASGHAFGVDLSEPMLDRARSTARDEGIANVTFQQGDAQVFEFPQARFDVAISRGGIMYFADPVAAFGNIGSALRPGGRLTFWCGREAAEDEFGAVWAAMGEHIALPDPAEDTAPGPATFTTEKHIREVLTQAGFHDVALRPGDAESVYGRDAADAADFIFGWGPVRFWLRDADEAAVAHAREAVTTALRGLENNGAVTAVTAAWSVSATWPGTP